MFGSAWFGSAWLGSAWSGSARRAAPALRRRRSSRPGRLRIRRRRGCTRAQYAYGWVESTTPVNIFRARFRRDWRSRRRRSGRRPAGFEKRVVALPALAAQAAVDRGRDCRSVEGSCTTASASSGTPSARPRRMTSALLDAGVRRVDLQIVREAERQRARHGGAERRASRRETDCARACRARGDRDARRRSTRPPCREG